MSIVLAMQQNPKTLQRLSLLPQMSLNLSLSFHDAPLRVEVLKNS